MAMPPARWRLLELLLPRSAVSRFTRCACAPCSRRWGRRRYSTGGAVRVLAECRGFVPPLAVELGRQRGDVNTTHQ